MYICEVVMSPWSKIKQSLYLFRWRVFMVLLLTVFRECMSPLKSGWNLSKSINAVRKFDKGLGEEWQAVVPRCVKWGSKSLENLGNSGVTVAWTQWAWRQQLEMGCGVPVVKIFRAWGHVKDFGFYSSMMGVNRKFGTRKWHDGIYV